MAKCIEPRVFGLAFRLLFIESFIAHRFWLALIGSRDVAEPMRAK